MNRGLVWAVIGFIMLTQYVNCSSYSDSTFYEGSNQIASSSVTSYEGVRVLNADTFMNCDEDHVQLGGACNTGDAFDNYIEVRMSRDRVPVSFGDASNPVSRLELAKCENGRFYAVVPKPNDPTVLGGSLTAYVEYQVQMQIYTKKKGDTFWKAGEKAPIFNIMIQPAAACNVSQ